MPICDPVNANHIRLPIPLHDPSYQTFDAFTGMLTSYTRQGSASIAVHVRAELLRTCRRFYDTGSLAASSVRCYRPWASLLL